MPYLPKDFEYPKSSDGEYLYLLAQINFTEIPTLEFFPKKGILQFYVEADGEIFGLNFENATQQDRFRVIYFPEPYLLESELITDFSFLPPIKKDDWLMPLEGCCALNFQHKFGVIDLNDHKFDFFETYGAESKTIWHEYFNKFCLDQHKIGGHPNFIQNDPRYQYSQDEEEYVLLFQMGMEDNEAIYICWADGGIANFFIKKSALEKLDFSEILYNWDCG